MKTQIGAKVKCIALEGGKVKLIVDDELNATLEEGVFDIGISLSNEDLSLFEVGEEYFLGFTKHYTK